MHISYDVSCSLYHVQKYCMCFADHHGVQKCTLCPFLVTINYIAAPSFHMSQWKDSFCVCIIGCVFAFTRMHSPVLLTFMLHACALHLCLQLPSSAGDECCEIRDGPVVFDTLMFWGNSQPCGVDQEDLVMTRKWRRQKYQGANDVMAQWWSSSLLIMLEETQLVPMMWKKFKYYCNSNALLNNHLSWLQYDLI